MWDQQEKKEEELDSPDRISLKKKRETSFRTQRKEERGHDDDPIFVFALPRWCAPSSRSYIPEKAKESLYYFGDGLTDGRSGWERLDLGKPLLAKCGKLGKWPKLPLLTSMWTWSKNTSGDESFLVLLGERRKEFLNQLQALPSGFKL